MSTADIIPSAYVHATLQGPYCPFEAQIWSPVQRFAWEINPRNYLLLACHAANETVQLNQLRRWYGYHYGDPTKTTPQVELAGSAHYICRIASRCSGQIPVSWAAGSHLLLNKLILLICRGKLSWRAVQNLPTKMEVTHNV